ncbi:hypothetical protein [Chlorobium sp.]|nr:hypothetical protein [Chlorobium sp.]
MNAAASPCIADMERQALASGGSLRKLEELRAFQGKDEFCIA